MAARRVSGQHLGNDFRHPFVGDLLEAEVLVFALAVEDYITKPDTKKRSNLWNSNDMHLKVAEHFV